MPPKITLSKNCSEAEFLNSVRINGLLKSNLAQTKGQLKIPDIEIIRVARDENDRIIAGIAGSTYLSSVEIDVLWVDENFRGQHLASRLLEELEAEAQEAGCQLAHLTTYSFQAPEFYRKQGYSICGEVTGFTDGISLYVLQKRLSATSTGNSNGNDKL